jgi:predicted  nucleic acid-binding Zn-ribbon protein
MDGREGEPGREMALPGQEADKVFKALPADLGAEKREFTEALRAQFRACGLSLRAFGARYHHDHTTVWRYLNALHIPDRDFVEDVLAAVDAHLGAPVTAEVQSHLYALHLAALKATSRNRYDNRVLSDRLVAETLQVQAARRQEQALTEELAQSRARDQQLRLRLRELEAARDEDQIRHGAELAGYQAENSQLRDELHRLRDRITTLQLLLGQARERRVQAEARCEQLEQSLAAIEQERSEELRLAEERRRQEEEGTLRSALADLQRQLAERDAEIAAGAGRGGARVRGARGAGERRGAEILPVRGWLLDIWAAACAHTMRSGKWTWGDAAGSNSVTDACQLLCFLDPATALPELRLEVPGNVTLEAGVALARFGGAAQTPRVLISALEEYLDRYTRPDGSGDFSGGSSLIPLDQEQRLPKELLEQDVGPSFAVSVRLCLAAMGFLDEYLNFLPQRSALVPWAARVREALSVRLTGALVGLLRGFTLNPMTLGSYEGRGLMRLLNQDGLPEHQVLAMFTERMTTVRGRLGEARLGVERAAELDDPQLLFEIGWTWGIASDAPTVELVAFGEQIGEQSAGLAVSRPVLYCTTQATEAIENLFSERAMALGVLNPDQERLASALRTRRDLTQKYWSRLARCGESWPLEDIPWNTVDGEESDYFSLLVCALVIQEFQQRNVDQYDMRRLEPLMSELADRARIIHRPQGSDLAVSMHAPGMLILMDTDVPVQTRFGWRAADFAPVLLKCAARLAMIADDPAVRDKLVDLATGIWNHLQDRLITAEFGLCIWDNPSRVFPSLSPTDGAVSWPLTSQIVDALVTAGTPPTW